MSILIGFAFVMLSNVEVGYTKKSTQAGEEGRLKLPSNTNCTTDPSKFVIYVSELVVNVNAVAPLPGVQNPWSSTRSQN
jgi:hypothetical protein